MDEPEPVRRIRVPRDESGPRRMNQGPAGRTRTLQGKAGAIRHIFFLQVNLGPFQKIVGQIRGGFSFRGTQGMGLPHQVGLTQKKILRPPLDADKVKKKRLHTNLEARKPPHTGVTRVAERSKIRFSCLESRRDAKMCRHGLFDLLTSNLVSNYP